MFTSHLRGHQRHNKLRNEEGEDEVGRQQQQQRHHKQQQHQERQPARVPPIQHHTFYRRDERLLDEQEDDEDEGPIEEEDWRQGAQMLSERDEMLLLAGSRAGLDTTDVAPVNRRRLQQQMRRSQSPSSSQQNRSPTPQLGARKSPASNKSASQLASRMLFSSGSSQKKQPVSAPRRVEEEPSEFELEQDDNSSISFAQSGCQSILSAWRLKAANRKRQRELQARPTSVLSNSSSVGKKSAASTAYTLASRLTAGGGKSPAAQTRIPLGPKSAQHFVTNSRRRRRANELILNTLEARRRALSLNRQQNLLLGAGGSLFGSESYLLAGAADPSDQLRGASPEQLLADYQRLSLSPSPLAARSPSPLVAAMSQRRPAGSGALSDLGGRQSALVRKVQANKLQNTAAVGAKSRSQSSLNRAPPLAKLDQNSSDLCSSNDSSSGESSSSSSSSSGESRFTQLVTSELAPVERALMAGAPLNQAAPRTRFLPAEPSRSPSRRAVESPTKIAARAQSRTPPPPVEPPKPPARTRRRQQQPEDLSASKPQVRRIQERQMVSSDEEEEGDDDGAGSRLRRGALKRDSIRRLRMSRQSSSKTSSSSSRDEPTGDSPKYQRQPEPLASASPSKQMQPLSKSRKLDIESNPFLNRHHFRSLSQRSSESGRQSVQSRRPATPSQLRGSQRSTRTSPHSRRAEEEPGVRRVEHLLRQMKPGQVLESRSQERESCRSDAMDSKTVDSRGNRRPAAGVRQDDLVIRSSPTKLSPQVEQQQQQQRTRKEVPKTRTTSQERDAGGRKEFKTTTRLVREGARSSDDVKVDLATNKRLSELTSERWRLEQVERAPERRADGSLVWGSSRLATSERVERLHSASISPPPEFSDRRARGAGDIERAPSARTLTSGRPIGAAAAQPALPPKPPSRSSLTTAARSAFSPPPTPTGSGATESRALDKQMRRAVSEERGRNAREWTSGGAGGKTGATLAGGRQPGERPAALAYQRPLSSQLAAGLPSPSRAREPQGSGATSAPAAARRAPEIDPIGARMLQANLPKFERTADDEFRKRVDQLRQLARANLHSSELEQRTARSSKILGEPKVAAAKKAATGQGVRPATGAAAGSSRFLTEQKPATLKPLSLNWAGPKDEGAKESPVVARTANLKSLEMSRARPTVASTNLDDMLLADRYQRPLPAGAWRRSNSSLASLSSARPAQRPASPFASRLAEAPKSSGSVLSQSAMSIGPREPSDAAELVPMRLVVKEKSAPRRDFAFVEQRPPVQRVEHRSTVQAPVSRPADLQSRRPQTPPRQQQQEQAVVSERPTTASPKPTLASQPSVQQAPVSSQLGRQQLLARSRLAGATSPRSPEFGATANSSSNDDSAIASSVSSPSLSFSMNPSGLQSVSEQRHSLATSRPLSSTTPTTSVQRPPAASTPTFQSQLTGLRVAAAQPEQKPQTQASGALQSILRRQQQLRRQQEARAEVSGEQREAQPATSSQAAGSYLVPLSSTSYTHTSQTSLTKTTTTLTRQPADGSSASINIQPGELRQFGDNRTSLHVREAPQEVSVQQEARQQSLAAPAPTNQKRVHFNDRTSVRSFESLSSENSNSTAINNGAQGQLTAEQQRQLIGSPDSMGSGSTSRLSCDSPDFRRVGSGGAIYAIRGDPELEQSPVNMLANQQQQVFAGGRQPLIGSQQQVMRYQQTIPMQLPRPAQQPVAVSIAQQQFNQRQQQAQMQQQQQQLSPRSLGSPTGCIRMTAPPVINTAGAAYASQMLASPRGSQQMLASPVMTARPSQPPSALGGQQQQQMPEVGRPSYLDEEEDPNYAFRLRQAAANRAFNFIQQQQQQQQPYSAPSNVSRAGPAAPSRGGGGGGGSQAQRRQPLDLVNFQTEV